jgi:cell division topological specificity factor
MFDVLMKIFGSKSERKSGQIAKERLQVVLIHDRASVSPEIMEQLKNDIIAVISKYMDVNKSGMEFSLENDSDSVALVANIPVKSLHHGRN